MLLQPIHLETTPRYNQSKLAFRVESLIKKIVNQWKTKRFYKGTMPYEKKVFYLTFKSLRKHLQVFLSLFRVNHQYTEYLDAFWYGCQQCGWVDMRCNPLSRVAYVDKYLVIKFIESVLSYSTKLGFRRKAAHRKQDRRANTATLKEHTIRVLNSYARVLVVRVDFAYQKAYQVDVCHFFSDMEEFIDLFQERKRFSKMIDYALSMEQSKGTGYHIHGVFYFKGYEAESDWYWANELGKLWMSVTMDTGRYFNCNDPKYLKQFELFGLKGVGMIHRDDPAQMENAIRTISYLMSPEKENQHLRMRPTKRRSFTRSKTDAW